MPNAVPCKSCGKLNLRFIERSEEREVWVHCDTCGNHGPPGPTRGQAGEAWNRANQRRSEEY